MNTIQEVAKSVGTLAILAIMMMVVVYAYLPASNVDGSAFTGSVAVQSVATTTPVGPQAVPAVTIFSNTKSCTARTITTGATAIRFLTGDPSGGNLSSTTLAANPVGLVQAASTTVMYDSGTFGCGRWTAYASASTTLTVVEYQ